jgi:hypothetical protein
LNAAGLLFGGKGLIDPFFWPLDGELALGTHWVAMSEEKPRDVGHPNRAQTFVRWAETVCCLVSFVCALYLFIHNGDPVWPPWESEGSAALLMAISFGSFAWMNWKKRLNR